MKKMVIFVRQVVTFEFFGDRFLLFKDLLIIDLLRKRSLSTRTAKSPQQVFQS